MAATRSEAPSIQITPRDVPDGRESAQVIGGGDADAALVLRSLAALGRTTQACTRRRTGQGSVALHGRGHCRVADPHKQRRASYRCLMQLVSHLHQPYRIRHTGLCLPDPRVKCTFTGKQVYSPLVVVLVGVSMLPGPKAVEAAASDVGALGDCTSARHMGQPQNHMYGLRGVRRARCHQKLTQITKAPFPYRTVDREAEVLAALGSHRGLEG